jgi:hypothetical protein
MSEILTILLTHQKADQVQRMLEFWSCNVLNADILVAYGGEGSEFLRIDAPRKIYVDDERLRTRDHIREKQSYSKVFHAASRAVNSHQYVWFVEYDHIPIDSSVCEKLINRLKSERADAICFHLKRVDKTGSPHFLSYAWDSEAYSFFEKVSCRLDKKVVLSMFGSGSFWTRETFQAVAEWEDPFPIHLEIFIPTIAHHLGFRLRDIADQNQFVQADSRPNWTLAEARDQGAWTVHPMKMMWDR